MRVGLDPARMTAALRPDRLRAWLRPAVVIRRLPAVLAIAAILFAIIYIVFLARQVPFGVKADWRTTTFGSAIHDPANFIRTTLDALTVSGLYFVVASGFTLIFGLMRVVNLAHGSFFLFGGYVALQLQREFVGGAFAGGAGGGLTSSQVSFQNWVLPLLIAAMCMALLGLLMQQVGLRWNQGQELRQALITIAVSIILADQMLKWFGGINKDIAWFGGIDQFVDLHVAGVRYSGSRLFILAIAVGIGIALYLWLHRTKTGMIIRAGVDDQSMVSALGINIQLVFAIAFVVGSALAGAGGVIGGSFAGLGPTVDGQWLVNSLVVVIIGGMGSLGGAAVGSLLYGIVTSFSATYLPTVGDNCCTQYSIIFTFALLTLVLAFRPRGLFGRAA